MTDSRRGYWMLEIKWIFWCVYWGDCDHAKVHWRILIDWMQDRGGVWESVGVDGKKETKVAPMIIITVPP